MTGNSFNEFVEVDNEIKGIRKYINENKFDKNSRYLIAYSVIRTCGVIEIVFKRLIHNYLSNGVSQDTEQYLAKKIIDSSINPKTGLIEKTLEEINPSLCAKFKSKTTNSEKSSINSLVSNRNDFAHGRNTSLSIEALHTYYESSKSVIEHLRSTCLINDFN